MESDEETITVEMKETTWRKLNLLKQPGDSFDDVVDRLVESGDEYQDRLDELSDRD
jgi:predicted CopG family antitoxin